MCIILNRDGQYCSKLLGTEKVWQLVVDSMCTLSCTAQKFTGTVSLSDVVRHVVVGGHSLQVLSAKIPRPRRRSKKPCNAASYKLSRMPLPLESRSLKLSIDGAFRSTVMKGKLFAPI